MGLIIRWFLSALVLFAIAFYNVIPGINVRDYYAALVAALVLGLINVLIKPIIMILTLPFNILTLGLFTLIINALLFWFAGTLVQGFTVSGFGAAFFGSLAMWIANWFIASLFKSN